VVASLTDKGLTSAAAEERKKEGRSNLAPPSASPPTSRILRRNLLNPINLILGAAVVAVFAVGEGLDAIFAIPLALNLAIGLFQELRAKRRLDQLTLLTAPRVRVVRDGGPVEVAIEDVVEDDLCLLAPGDQVVADGTLVASQGLELDESALTGEADPVDRDAGDAIMSGSFAVAGEGAYRAERVGEDSMAARLLAEAQSGRERLSPLQRDIIRLLERMAFVAVPVMIAYLVVQLAHDLSVKETVRNTVTASVSLIPEGLLLLTSARFALGAVRLADKGLVVSRLDAVESLARVTVLCLDKTGTLTENRLSVVDVMPASGVDRADLEAALGRFAASMPAGNRTLAAIADAFPAAREEPVEHVPFSSARRWSGVVLSGTPSNHAWVMGAPESFDDVGDLASKATDAVRNGHRVVFVGRSRPLSFSGVDRTAPPPSDPAGLVVLDDRVRPGASDTLGYFADQNVVLKLLSGDNPETVRAIAERAGLEAASWTTGAEIAGLSTEGLAKAVDEHQIFGRVSPQQKRDLVDSLRAQGHHVAMTGDGVNDVLALRTADLGIALQEGTAAAQAVSSLVMLEGAFLSLPETVKEGRRIVHGITVVARLFLLKTFYSALITAAVTAIAVFAAAEPDYPFRPRNLSMMATFSIGVPAFFLTLAPRRPDPMRGRFITEVLRLSVPAAVVAAAAALTTFYVERHGLDATLPAARSAVTLSVCVVAMAFIPMAEMAARHGQRQLGLALALAAALSVAFPVIFAVARLRHLYDLVPLDGGEVAVALVSGIAAALILLAVTAIVRRAPDR